MERNSFIPWNYSKCQGLLGALFFIAGGIALSFKSMSSPNYFPLIFILVGVIYAIYIFSGYRDRWRRKKGYYEITNPPLIPNLLMMVGNISALTGIVLAWAKIPYSIYIKVAGAAILLVAYWYISFMEGYKAKK